MKDIDAAKQAIGELRFDFDAVIRLEEKGIKLMDGGLTPESVRKPQTFISLYWAGRLHEQPELTEDQAKAQLKGVPVRHVVNALTAAIKDGLGSDEAADAPVSPTAN